MRVASWQHYAIDARKMAGLACAFGAASCALFWLGTRGAIGGASAELAVLVGVIFAYFVASAPRRLLDSTALTQSRGAMTLAASASASLEATHSRARAVLLLRSDDRLVQGALTGAGRSVLLGTPPAEALNVAAGALASYSLRNVMASLGALDPGRVAESGEEKEGILASSQLSEESRLPLFMAVAFFTPMLLTLYAVFSHLSGAASFAELIGIQIVLVDIAFYFCSTERGRE